MRFVAETITKVSVNKDGHKLYSAYYKEDGDCEDINEAEFMKASEWANMDPLPTAPPIVLEALRVQELADKALEQARSAKPACDEMTAVHVQLELRTAG